MKAVILAGGLGTRISEETSVKPKPMVEIGGKPILWHIMKIYSAHGINDFIICLGYKGYMINTRPRPSPGASRWSTPAMTR
jgi:glucose-1-phosphate cytidylyltransferase